MYIFGWTLATTWKLISNQQTKQATNTWKFEQHINNRHGDQAKAFVGIEPAQIGSGFLTGFFQEEFFWGFHSSTDTLWRYLQVIFVTLPCLKWQSLLGKSDGKSSLFPGPAGPCQDHPKERHLVHHGFSRDLRDSPAAWPPLADVLVGDGPNFDASDSPAEVHESLAAPRHEDEDLALASDGIWTSTQRTQRSDWDGENCNCNIVIYIVILDIIR